ncbi:MAG: T9SS type A sorting domain-containing protein [Bacteroidota bacterium]
MKKTLLFSIALCFGVFAQAQTQTIKVPASLRNQAVKRPVRNAVDMPTNLSKASNPSVNSQAAISDSKIGSTVYDLQTNQAIQNRIVRWSDGTIAATWTQGNASTSYADRGTGYNYFDGNNWAAIPTARIESNRTGWPSICKFGANGEITASHNGATGLEICKRTTKGTGAWTQTLLTGPTGSAATGTPMLWPRMITNGPNNDNIHIIACTDPGTSTAPFLYKGQTCALLYSRSTDGGATWDKQGVVLSQLDSNFYKGFGGDSYAWANPIGDTIAFVLGDNWVDGILMKSTDNGNTWTKTVFFQHPYQKWTDAVLTPDTPYVVDGAMNVALDPQGKAHVFFGFQRVLNTTANDNLTSYFPYIDGMGYWKEGQPAVTDLNPSTAPCLIAAMLDENGNGTNDMVLPAATSDPASVGQYYISLTSMPYATIDAQGGIYLTYSSVSETKNNGTQNYRRLWAKKSTDGGTTWSNPTDLVADPIHDFDECVYASMARDEDSKLHIVYQADSEPGQSLNTVEADAPGPNDIRYLSVTKDEIGASIGINEVKTISSTKIYPNPTSENASLAISMKSNAELTVSIVNLMGQVVKSVNYNATTGLNVLDLNANSLTAGIYLIRVQNGKELSTQKLIVR